MPKKGTNALRVSQPSSSAIPAHMRSQFARASSISRKPVSGLSKQVERDEDEMQVDDEDAAGAEDEGEDENMVEMLTMLQEFQKRKATKTTARSVAFQRDKAALFADSRIRAGNTVRNGLASIERARATVAELKANELSQESKLGNLKGLLETQEQCLQDVLGQFTGVIEDLSHRRAAHINGASAMLESQAAAREKSRKRLCALANSRMSENMENQKIASDATALVKHYKALLLS